MTPDPDSVPTPARGSPRFTEPADGAFDPPRTWDGSDDDAAWHEAERALEEAPDGTRTKSGSHLKRTRRA